MIRNAKLPDDQKIVRQLFTDYAAFLGIDLGFQNFEKELMELDSMYAPPKGGILLVEYQGYTIGCAAIRQLTKNTCELKRMYLCPETRGKGFGKSLLSASFELAKELSYRFMRLDTLSTLVAAVQLYESAGFYPISAYRHNPMPNALYYEKDLLKDDKSEI